MDVFLYNILACEWFCSEGHTKTNFSLFKFNSLYLNLLVELKFPSYEYILGFIETY